ncbi:LLM class flavin-dependent oxidoreductase [Metapseudomonas resinovorans]|uniref:Putative oxidoreductase n=1 Tax=Metapseudomonas resinovorans NBRC 106553 TaxID=1245471 RepID=S6AF26_METRE|nr:LLM class flavin-dependent oxidoreductase [Pseudomonas resinovorans]BAN48447.1 putative oxidoreductase [Pseudomonas resinovorans NBRC 106553]
MEFNHFLSSYLPDPQASGRQLYDDMVEQAVVAEQVGYAGISIPEHHLINILLVPSPLQMAVKIASVTRRIELVTSIAVLPIRDMRVFAGEVVQADALSDSRLVLGVGRGAFRYEIEKLGVPMDSTRERFDESLAVLEALLTREEVSWDGKYYQFDPLTIMPRPEREIPLMVATMAPEGIRACARQGFSVQTTPLSGDHQMLLDQVNAFRRGKAEARNKGAGSRLSLQRATYLARDEADAREKLQLAHEYYMRFDNVFTGPGIVRNGAIEPLPRKQSIEELGNNLLICTRERMLDQLAIYAEAGIDEVIMTANFGQSQEDTLDMMQRFGEQIIPYFSNNQPAKTKRIGQCL